MRGQIAAHQRDWTHALTLDDFGAVRSSPRVYALCTGSVEPHGADPGISAGNLDRSDQVHDVSSATGLSNNEHTSQPRRQIRPFV
jgi:hypothetical protein